MKDAHVRKHLRMTGRVQGVFYRDTAQRQAQALGILGWIRNCPDGTVEAVAEGPPDAVAAFVQWCHRGSSAARVDSVEAEIEPATGEFQDFQITY